MGVGMGSGPLTSAELRTVLEGYGLGAPDDEVPRVVTARVLHLTRTGGGVAIKVFAATEAGPAQAEAALLAHLRGHADEDYRVLEPRPTGDGRGLLALGERRVLVTRWVTGVHRSYREIDASGWATLGRTLAALHRRLDDAPAIPLRSVVEELRARRLDEDRRLMAEHRRRAEGRRAEEAPLVSHLLAQRLVLLERHAARAQATLPPDERRPLHNDYNVHNYLFHEEGPPTILDWERAMHGPREYEVCRCLNHLPLVAPALAWAFVDGYLERRSLDPDRVEWALHAAVSAHALKHWPVELWLADAPGAAARLAGMAEIVRSLVDGAAELETFGCGLRARIRERATP